MKQKQELLEKIERIEKQKKQALARLQQIKAREKAMSRKEEAHALCCLAGALLKYYPAQAEQVLNRLEADPKSPARHVEVIKTLLKRSSTHNIWGTL